MNKEELEILAKYVDNQLFEIVNNLICPICHELLIKPVTTPCGHCFCSGCIRKVLSTKNSGCPLCKYPVKKSLLKSDKVKSTVVDICKELPSAFEKDVQDLNPKLNGVTADLIKASKLSQWGNQELPKDFKTNKKKCTKPKPKAIDQNENESGTFLPVLKRTKNVIEYASAKKKRLDDLVSISQTEAPSNSSKNGTSEVEKKLGKIEKLPVEVKVNEWFDAVGDNIYHNSPNSLVESLPEEHGEKENLKSEMIRRDYYKTGNSLQSKTNEPGGDPYEFIPSQNNAVKKKRPRRSVGKEKKIPDFQALQNFTKENIKRAAIINLSAQVEPERNEGKEEIPKSQNIFTASQKFEKLLSEPKENEKSSAPKTHVLYSASRASSPKFLDSSFESISKSEKLKNKLLSSGEEDSRKGVELFKYSSVTKGKRKSKRRRSFEVRKSTQKKKKLSLEETRKEETVAQNDCKTSKTKLLALLEELVNDNVIYSSLKTNQFILSTENKQNETLNSRVKTGESVVSQKTGLTGFCTQGELPEVRKFKQMVADLEEELNFEQNEVLLELETTTNQITPNELETNADDSNSRAEKDHSLEVMNEKKTKKLFELPEKQGEHQRNLVSFNLLGKIKRSKILFINFLRLGSLTPTVKRSKNSVVKLVFPAGLSSLARKRSRSKVAVGIQTSMSPPRKAAAIQTSQEVKDSLTATSTAVQTSQEVEDENLTTCTSAAVQTSQLLGKEFPTAAVQTSQYLVGHSPTVSAGVQTSQCLKSSAMIQTTQLENFSVEIQTSQIFTSSAGIQTTQTDNKTAAEIQTSQVSIESAGVQTSEVGQITTGNQTTQKTVVEVATETSAVVDILSPQKLPNSMKKPCFKHKKILKKLSVDNSVGSSPVSPADVVPLQTQDLLIDSATGKEFDTSWYTQRNNENLVEMKNRKNREESQKKREDSPDRQSENSDVQPPKRSIIRRILSEDSCSPVPRYETRQRIPLDVRKVTPMEQVEVIDLGTPKPQEENSQEQMLRVLKNIDMDLPSGKKKPEESAKEEKSEESDSDFFVEQTPPRTQLPFRKGNPKRATDSQDSMGLIGGFIPKAMLDTESFLMLSAPEKIIKTPEKISDLGKRTPKGKVPQVFDHKSNENNQNQLNASVSKTHKAKAEVVEPWKRSEESQKKVKSQQRRKLCIAASSVKNPETIRKFAGKFKIEQLNKPTKSMTHLIVGLHENDEGEVLPLCTPKLLFAMANKKWVVSELWVETCLKLGEIVAEETFETPDPVGGCGCRNARMSTELLLGDCEIFFMGAFQTISKEDLAELIKDCGGTLVPKPEKFSFSPAKIRMIIADRDCLTMNEKQLRELYEKYSTVILSRDVIIMSIQSYKLANFTPYLLHPAPEEDLLKMGYPPSLARNEEEEEGEEDDRWSSAK